MINLETTISIYAGGPGSGCNPQVGKCGRRYKGNPAFYYRSGGRIGIDATPNVIKEFERRTGMSPEHYAMETVKNVPKGFHKFGNNKQPSIQIKKVGGKFEVELNGNGWTQIRQFDFSKGVAHHIGIDLSPKLQGHGIGTKIFNNTVALYKQMGINLIKTRTGHEPYQLGEAGGYVWARLGFTPNQKSWDKLRNQLKKEVGNNPKALKILNNSDPKAIADFAALSIGKRYLVKKTWWGTYKV